MPKFAVSIDAADHYSVKDGKVRAIIRSKYTYGELVRGRAIVLMRPTNYWSALRGTDTIAKLIEINGKGVVEFHITDDLQIAIDESKRSMSYTLTATVIDSLTGEASQPVCCVVRVYNCDSYSVAVVNK